MLCLQLIRDTLQLWTHLPPPPLPPAYGRALPSCAGADERAVDALTPQLGAAPQTGGDSSPRDSGGSASSSGRQLFFPPFFSLSFFRFLPET